MKVEFKTYCGLTGDTQELLLAKSESGIEEAKLISRIGCFRYFWMKRAKKKLLKRLELRTGRKHFEK